MPVLLPMCFSPGQVHYGFNMPKEMTVKHSLSERVIPNFISMVAGQSLILFTQSDSACSKPISATEPVYTHNHPLGLSARTAVLWLCPQCCHHFSLCSALLYPCSHATMSPRALGVAFLYRVTNNVLPTHV